MALNPPPGLRGTGVWVGRDPSLPKLEPEPTPLEPDEVPELPDPYVDGLPYWREALASEGDP